jgi:hypothetical protein
MSTGQKWKRCSGCGLVQPLDQFDANPRHRDGRASHCKACRRVRQRARGHPWARRRAQRWLARRHPQRWAERFQARNRQARAELPPSQAKRAHSRAWTRALADLQAEFPDEYQARYQVELAAYRREHGHAQPVAGLSKKVDPRVLAQARAAALEALASLYPEQAQRLVGPVLAGLSADASAETKTVARLLALDRLRALHPRQFQAHYAAELARHATPASQEPPSRPGTGVGWAAGCQRRRRRPGPATRPRQRAGRGWSSG